MIIRCRYHAKFTFVGPKSAPLASKEVSQVRLCSHTLRQRAAFFSEILKTKQIKLCTHDIYNHYIIVHICLHNTLSIYAATTYMHAVFPRRYSISFSPLKHLVCVSCSLQNCKTTQNSHTSIQVDKTCHH